MRAWWGRGPEPGASSPCTHPPVLQAKNERNYHIFYELLAGLPAQLRQVFSLQEAETYYYLNQVSEPAGGRCPLAAAAGAGGGQDLWALL